MLVRYLLGEPETSRAQSTLGHKHKRRGYRKMHQVQRYYMVIALASLGLLALMFSLEWINQSYLLSRIISEHHSTAQKRFFTTREYILKLNKREIEEYNDYLTYRKGQKTENIDSQFALEYPNKVDLDGSSTARETGSTDRKNALVGASEREYRLSQDDERNKLCGKSRSWAACIKYSFCAWRMLPNKEFCAVDGDYKVPEMTLEEYNPEYDYKYDENDDRKYFVYQTSGGFNNQRILLENALIICQLLNRTCVAPPVAPHTNYFQKYNIQPGNKLTSMQRILNFHELNKIVGVVSIPQGQSFMDWLNERHQQKDGKWKNVFRSYKSFRPGEMPKWNEGAIKRKFKNVKQKFLFFQNTTMWAAFDWKGTIAGWPQKLNVHRHMMYNNVIKRVARKLSESLGPDGAYNAIHVRRGDKTTEANFKRVSHNAKWYQERMLEFKEEVPALYIATDEANRAYFTIFKDTSFNVTFWEDLDREILLPFLNRYPSRMFMDILSVIEQLLCTYAIKFLGSGYSTLTTFVLRMRKHRKEIAFDTELGPEEGLPFYARTTETTCNPVQSLTHSTPC